MEDKDFFDKVNEQDNNPDLATEETNLEQNHETGSVEYIGATCLFDEETGGGNDSDLNLTKEKKNKDKKRVSILLLSILMGFSSGIIGSTFMTSIDPSITKDVIYQNVTKKDTDGNELGVLTAEEIVQNVKDSVVEISTSTMVTSLYMGQYVTSGAGSGVVLSEEGLIVTNHHVIDGADSIKVRLNNGSEYQAELIASDAQTDLAVLRIDAKDLKPAVALYANVMLQKGVVVD